MSDYAMEQRHRAFMAERAEAAVNEKYATPASPAPLPPVIAAVGRRIAELITQIELCGRGMVETIEGQRYDNYLANYRNAVAELRALGVPV